MNQKRRKEVEQAKDLIEQGKTILEGCATEERDYYDNMPENLQNGERGNQADASAEALETAVSCCDDVLQHIEEALQ